MTSPNILIPPVLSDTEEVPVSDPELVVHAYITSSAREVELLAELALQHGVHAVVITDPDKAATLYEAQAHRQNDSGGIRPRVNPIDFGDTARQVVKAGGSLVQFSYLLGNDLSSLYRAVEAAQNAEAPTPKADV